MFGSKVKKASKNATRAVGPMIRIADRHYGLPDRIWRDPYFLGFIGGFVSLCVLELRPSSIEADKASVTALTALSGTNGDFLYEKFTTWLNERHGDVEWGFDNATLIYAYQNDRLNSDFDDAQLFDLIAECQGEKDKVVYRLMKERFFDHVSKFVG